MPSNLLFMKKLPTYPAPVRLFDIKMHLLSISANYNSEDEQRYVVSEGTSLLGTRGMDSSSSPRQVRSRRGRPQKHCPLRPRRRPRALVRGCRTRVSVSG